MCTGGASAKRDPGAPGVTGLLMAPFWSILSIYLLYRLVRVTVNFLKAVVVYRVIPQFWKPELGTVCGDRWCVVTGCTDGIGKSYTHQLAKFGIKKFLLIGRSAEKLGLVEKMLKSTKSGLQIERLLFDFQNDDQKTLGEKLNKYDIGFLLHAVGIGPSVMRNMFEDIQLARDIMHINYSGSLEMVNAVVPRMMASGGGQIVLVSSAMGYRPGPYLSTYPTSKCGVTFLASTINSEYNKSGINCQAITPALVATKLSHYDSAEGPWIVTPEAFAEEAIKTVGLINETSGCFNHEIQNLLRHALPWCLLYQVMMQIFKVHQKRLDEVNQKNAKDE